jgi:hypothetical protein
MEGICGSGIQEGSDEDDALSKSGVYLPDEPGMFKFQEPQKFGNLTFEGRGKRGDSSNEEEEGCNADGMQEIGSDLKQLDKKLHLLIVTIKANQIGMMENLWGSILCLGSAIEAIHTRI